MKKLLFILLAGLCVGTNAADNFAKDKLVAWCIVPLTLQRGPAARAYAQKIRPQACGLRLANTARERV